jgi:hypothetical protein
MATQKTAQVGRTLGSAPADPGTEHDLAGLARFKPIQSLLKDPQPLSLKVLGLRLSDQWAQELRRFRTQSSQGLKLPVLDLSLPNKKLPLLLQAGKHPFVPVEIQFQGLNFKGEVRLRGYKPWHVAETKKSLRIKLKKGDFILGHRLFNLNNPDRPVLFEETLVLQLAHNQGLITTASDFARLRLNGLDLGVYAYTTPLDEVLLRKHHRIPADLYSLEKRQKGFQNTGPWKYITWYDSEAKNFAPLSQFLKTLQQASDQEFQDFASHHLNLKDFATLEILHRLFAETDSSSDAELNYALYFDPYRGLWEPVLHEFTGLGLGIAPPFNDPLLTRLGQVPAYQQARAEVFEHIISEAKPEKLRQQGRELISRLAPDLEADPYWRARGIEAEGVESQGIEAQGIEAQTAAKKQPRSLLERELMRPMSLQSLATAFELRLQSLEKRLNALPDLLVSPKVIFPSRVQLKATLKLGPGRIEIPLTRQFEADQPVQIAPGTTFALGAGASLIFKGPVQFLGSTTSPIRLLPAGQKRWGGLVLQGRSTAGSRLSGVIASGGSQPVSPPYIYPGMINFHDTRQISLSDCQFSNNLHSDDLIHTAYVQDLKAERITISQAFSDAWDLEFSQAQIADLRIQTSGDDGIDLMDTVLEITRSVIQDSQGNGISAGEQSNVTVSHSLIAHAGTGILAKNASFVQMSQSLLFENRKGLEIYQESPFYPGWSRITGSQIFISGGQPLALDGVSEKAIAPPVYTQIDPASAPNTAANVAAKRLLAPLFKLLGLSEFKHLPQKLISQKKAKQP